MDDKTFYTLLVSVLLALLGLIGKYWNDLRIAQRKDRLERINAQIRELYGPLTALRHAGGTAWAVFRQRYRPGGGFFGACPAPTQEELEAWRLWMREVFMPLNLRMEQVILSSLHLLREGPMPECFEMLLAHIAAYKPVLKKWDGGDYGEHTSVINFPAAEMDQYLNASYSALLSEQQALLAEQNRPERRLTRRSS